MKSGNVTSGLAELGLVDPETGEMELVEGTSGTESTAESAPSGTVVNASEMEAFELEATGQAKSEAPYEAKSQDDADSGQAIAQSMSNNASNKQSMNDVTEKGQPAQQGVSDNQPPLATQKTTGKQKKAARRRASAEQTNAKSSPAVANKPADHSQTVPDHSTQAVKEQSAQQAPASSVPASSTKSPETRKADQNQPTSEVNKPAEVDGSAKVDKFAGAQKPQASQQAGASATASADKQALVGTSSDTSGSERAEARKSGKPHGVGKANGASSRGENGGAEESGRAGAAAENQSKASEKPANSSSSANSSNSTNSSSSTGLSSSATQSNLTKQGNSTKQNGPDASGNSVAEKAGQEGGPSASPAQEATASAQAVTDAAKHDAATENSPDESPEKAQATQGKAAHAKKATRSRAKKPQDNASDSGETESTQGAGKPTKAEKSAKKAAKGDFPMAAAVRRELTPSRAPLTIMVAFALILLSLYGILECGLLLFGQPALLVDPQTALETVARWPEGIGAAVLGSIGTVVILLGLIILANALIRGRRARRELLGYDVAVVVDDDVLAEAIARKVRMIAGVTQEQVVAVVSGRKISVHIRPTSGFPLDAQEIKTELEKQLHTMNLKPTPEIKIQVLNSGVVGV